MTTELAYVGEELDLFARATNWKAYLSREIQPALHGDVAEVGAGIGSMTRVLMHEGVRSWTCIEPDRAMAGDLADRIRTFSHAARIRVVPGVLNDLPSDTRFDAIIYIDVLEHIEDDAGELATAAAHLAPGGTLVVLAPAHQWLFSPFDSALGHFRRYDKRALAAAAPPSLRLERLDYLDAAGLTASIANRVLLDQQMPTPAQIGVWDRVLVPVSRAIDPLFAGAVGKSVLAIWRKDATAGTST